MDLPSRNQVIGYVVAGVVLGCIIWLTTFDGLARVRGWVTDRPEIQVLSPPKRSTYFLGEKLHLTLANAKATRVIWIVDDSAPALSSVDFEYAFPHDTASRTLLPQKHRIDALYRERDEYQPATILLDLEPPPRIMASLAILRDSILQLLLTDSVRLQANTGRQWALDKAALARYDAGRFVPVAVFTKDSNPGPNDQASYTLVPGHGSGVALWGAGAVPYAQYRYRSGSDSLVFLHKFTPNEVSSIDSLRARLDSLRTFLRSAQ